MKKGEGRGGKEKGEKGKEQEGLKWTNQGRQYSLYLDRGGQQWLGYHSSYFL